MIKRNIWIFTLLALILVNINAEVNTENLKIDDLGTFLVKRLNLTPQEAKMSADKLYKIGISLLYKKGEMKKVKLSDGTVIDYPTADNQRKAMKYLVAAGLLGNPKAAVEAISWLNIDPWLEGSNEYKYALAEKLSKDGYLYGTYLLGLGYATGNGIARNRNLALYYLGIVRDYCKHPSRDVYESLALDKYNSKKSKIINFGKRRCMIANTYYLNVKNTKFITNKPLTNQKNFNEAMRKKLRDMLINKQNKAIQNYLKGENKQ